VALASFFALSLAAACSSGEQTVLYHSDYPAYNTVDELYAKADVVVEARLTGPMRVQEQLPVTGGADPQANPEAGAEGANAASDPIIVTVYQAHVTRVLKGQAKNGDAVEVKQLGGSFKGVNYEEAEGRPLKPGTPYLLFLQTFPDAPASLLNPDQAQYPLDQNGKPASLPDNPIRINDSDLERVTRGG
jgi:hypothetical protein